MSQIQHSENEEEMKPKYEAELVDQPVNVGIGSDCSQVLCPTCHIIIALPNNMLYFRCPRCLTECMAPPPQNGPQVQSMEVNLEVDGKTIQYVPTIIPPSNGSESATIQYVPSIVPPNSDNKEVNNSTNDINTNSGNFSPHTSGSNHISPISSERLINEISQDSSMQNERKQLLRHFKRASTLTPEEKRVQRLIDFDRRMKAIHYPNGNFAIGLRSFSIMQAPLINIYFAIFLMCFNPREKKILNQTVDWYDTSNAKVGAVIGALCYAMWITAFIYKAVSVGTGNSQFIFALLASVLGPFVLAAFCWFAPSVCLSGGSACGDFGASGFDCGDCGACECGCDCGACDCGGCDCGGCDC